MKRKTLLLIAPNNASFVQQDEQGLSEWYRVKKFIFGEQKGWKMFFQQMRLLGWLSIHIWCSQRVLCWFADYHSFFPSLFGFLFRKKCAIIIGGYDAAKIAEYNYGAHNKEIRSVVIKWSCYLANWVLPVSNFVSKELRKNLEGLGEFKIRVVHNGIDLDFFTAIYENFYPRSGIICISSAEEENRAMIKGIDRFLDLAIRMQNEEFTLVGIRGQLFEILKMKCPKNLKILGILERGEIKELLMRSKVICQFSRFESFGLAVAEGMLCGCIPVLVPDIGSVEILANECGFISPSTEGFDIYKTVEKALKSDEECPMKLRTHIINEFGLQKRLQELVEIMEAGS